MIKLCQHILTALLVLMVSLVVAAEDDTQGYLQVTGPCGLEFPRDHGAHPGYRTEWWYYTGNLQSESGQPFGFQLTLFRSQLTPSSDNGKPAKQKSAWRTNQVYFGHLAVSDIYGGRHWQAENMARGALGLAGTEMDGRVVKIWLHNWSIQMTPDSHMLSAQTPDFGLELTTRPSKNPVRHGDDGYSKKGGSAQHASCYYSYTRMVADGRLTLGERSVPVSGQSWMDHEFSTAPLEPGIVGWDWFSLQLSDNSEIMFFLLRTDAGELHADSSGSFIDRSGKSTHLDRKQIRVSVLDRWKSPASGANYPSRWRVQISSLELDLVITSRLADQEMRTAQSTGVTYWEGSVSIDGRVKGVKVGGGGYVELTGYAGTFKAPL